MAFGSLLNALASCLFAAFLTFVFLFIISDCDFN